MSELEELGKKGLFSKPELAVIMKKRSDFEYRINSRQPKASDYLRYVQYEINVDRLRAKRSKRLLGSSSSGGLTRYSGQRRAFFIFDRATKKLSGNIALWLQYLEYAKSQNSSNVVAKIFTSLLQLHPLKPDLWVLAAKYEAEQNASMVTARTILQRGLRFNSESDYLWLEYMKLELIYASKILTRRKLLGIDEQLKEAEADAGAEKESIELTSSDLVASAKLDLPDVNMSMLGSVETNPALKGDIALAIFDSAMPKVKKQSKFAEDSVELFVQFGDLDKLHLLDHVANYLKTHGKGSTLYILTPLRAVDHSSEDFPDMVKAMISRWRSTGKDSDKTQIKTYVESILEEGIDDNIKTVLRSFVRTL